MPKLGTIFSELLKLCPRYQFDRAVERYSRFILDKWSPYILN